MSEDIPEIIDNQGREPNEEELDKFEEMQKKQMQQQLLRDVQYQGAQRAAFAPPEPEEMTDNYATTKFLEEVDMPMELQAFGTKFWAAISKDIKLSNLTDDNIQLIMLMFDSAKQRFLMSMPEKDFTFEKAIQFLKYPKNITKDITIHIGPYGYYMKYNGKNFKINQSGKYTEEYCLSILRDK